MKLSIREWKNCSAIIILLANQIQKEVKHQYHISEIQHIRIITMRVFMECVIGRGSIFQIAEQIDRFEWMLASASVWRVLNWFCRCSPPKTNHISLPSNRVLNSCGGRRKMNEYAGCCVQSVRFNCYIDTCSIFLPQCIERGKKKPTSNIQHGLQYRKRALYSYQYGNISMRI